MPLSQHRPALAGLLLVLLAAFALGESRARAFDPQSQALVTDPIAATALQYNGTYQGQCWEFAKKVVYEATGKTMGFDYVYGFFEAGAVEVFDPAEVRAGDIIQIVDNDWSSPDADYPGLHTAIVLENYGDGTFKAIDSNQNWDGMVGFRDPYAPYALAAARGLDVRIFRFTGGTAPSPGPVPGPTLTADWHPGETGHVNTPGDVLNLRSGPGTFNGVVAQLPHGTFVTAIGQNTVVNAGHTWVNVATEYGEGWVAAEFLLKDPLPPVPPPPVAPQAPPEAPIRPPNMQVRGFAPAVASEE